MTGTRAKWSFTPELDEADIYVWDGNYYALAVTERLGLEDSGGMGRVGPGPQNRWFTTQWRRSSGLVRYWGGLRQAMPESEYHPGRGNN